jgi:hypothetical protein
MTPRIIEELCGIVQTSRPQALKRMRLAVSPEEYEEIKQYMFGLDGKFYMRIMNVPLVVEPDPENPPLLIEGY